MHASEAFINGAANKGRTKYGKHEDLNMINTLMSGAAVDPGKPSADERKADEERKHAPATTPGGFKNDPDDASNPNEVRELHLRKVKQTQP
jgi:hypothetical protein